MSVTVNHVVLALSSASAFFVCYVGSQLLSSLLNDAGYDPFRTLLGLEQQPENMSSPLIKDFSTNQFAQLLAIALTAVTTVVLFLKFSKKSKKPVLDPQNWQEFQLRKKTIVSPNTAIYRFALPNPDDVLGLPIGQHISVSATINGKEIMRSYTPTSSDDDVGHFELLIKAYEKGNISRHVSLLRIGDKLRVKGPKGKFVYSPDLSRELGMIAGGTGITPMLQIIRAALKNPEDKTKISLIYANVNPEDILLKAELDDLAAAHPTRFTVFYVLNNPPAGWTGGSGFVSKEQIEKHLPSSSHDVKVLLCGPPPMMNAMKVHLSELKYTVPTGLSKLADQVFLF
ncbi:ferredoxin reductase-like C-terminal NADP-linked domain-containing protein [Thelephora terrestris]|uniref:NADH-cytochrome b5 reductase n=1 Tax=Thelephora terrestris TaxID=56493 RepID=A0A9P6L8P4_9AGAM|nr:ferredoxin reductase-like C-terminal NADP-linked domain-containing protein [Thelephora terrestris]